MINGSSRPKCIGKLLGLRPAKDAGPTKFPTALENQGNQEHYFVYKVWGCPNFKTMRKLDFPGLRQNCLLRKPTRIGFQQTRKTRKTNLLHGFGLPKLKDPAKTSFSWSARDRTATEAGPRKFPTDQENQENQEHRFL